MTYDERKAQLYETMRDVLSRMEYGFCFDADEKKREFMPLYCGKPRREWLSEIYITDGPEETISVHTCYLDEDNKCQIEASSFDEFSNTEMEEILSLCNIPIPEEII